jgi:hypothetical protein
MRRRLLPHLTYANVMVTILAFIVLGGGTALAAYVVSSNSQIGPGTVSGHKPPSGNHANIISGSVNATDLANQAVTAAKIQAPEAWHQVGPGSTSQDLCADPSNTAVFCSFRLPDSFAPWHHFGGSFAAAGFYKDQLGIVHLKGLVTGPTEQGANPEMNPIFRLPSAYRPAHQRVFPTIGRSFDGQEASEGRVDIQQDGLVVLLTDCDPNFVDCSANGGYVTLDAISFRRDG